MVVLPSKEWSICWAADAALVLVVVVVVKALLAPCWTCLATERQDDDDNDEEEKEDRVREAIFVADVERLTERPLHL